MIPVPHCGSSTRQPGSAAAAALCAALAALGCTADAPVSAPPNIVLITVDTLRADHLESYGHDRSTAPAVARLAAAGVRFEHAVSAAPWTLPSMASLHTGLYPSQHGAVGAETALPAAAETVAETLKEAGYATVAVVSHEFIGAKHGFSQGFDVFDESNIRGHEAVTSKDLTMTALAAIAEVSEPFFLWVHYFDPHFTYVRHADVGFADGYTGALPDKLTSGRLRQEEGSEMAAYDLDYVRAVYDEEIAHTDHWVGVLWETLTSRVAADRTVVVFTADHGEYFLERGRFFHGRDVYEPLVHVPLVIGGAIDEDLRGAVVADSVAVPSVAATVTSIAGIDEHGFAGPHLLEVASGAVPPPPVYAEGSWAFGDDERKLAVVHDGWKLIRNLDDDRYELYELAADPDERNDRLATTAPAGAAAAADGAAGVGIGAHVARLRGLLDRLAALPRLAPQAVGLTPEERRRLEALGYIR